MGMTIRRLKRSVQKVARASGLNAEDTALVVQTVEVDPGFRTRG
jgi:hypothetical protein